MITNDPNYDTKALHRVFSTFAQQKKKSQGGGNHQTLTALEQEHWCPFQS